MEELADAGRMVVERGLVLASGGNLSARVPGAAEFVVTAAGTWLDRLRPGDFTTMTLDGEVVTGHPRPSTEWKLHQRTYRARGDVNAVIHLHPQHAVLLDALGYEIRLLTLDHAAYVSSIGRIGYYPNGSDELADAAAAEIVRHNCLIMAYHGCSSVADDVGMALRRALNLEEAAVATYRALTLGDTTTAFPEHAWQSLRHG